MDKTHLYNRLYAAQTEIEATKAVGEIALALLEVFDELNQRAARQVEILQANDTHGWLARPVK